MGRTTNYRAKIRELMKSWDRGLLKLPAGNHGLGVGQEPQLHGFEKVLRLLDALKSVGMEEYPGVCTMISKATSYSKSRVSDMLSGKAPLNPRFVKAVCAAFGTNEEYILRGTGEMNASASCAESARVGNIAIREAVSLLENMSEPDRCRAVAMLKEMSKVFDKETAH